jgi:hypothetical protein
MKRLMLAPVLLFALTTPVAANEARAETLTSKYAGAWSGMGRLEGAGICSSPFTMDFEVTADGHLVGTIDMKRAGGHGGSGLYPLSGRLENDGRLRDAHASKATVLHLSGKFDDNAGRGTIVFAAGSCSGDWTVTRGNLAKP